MKSRYLTQSELLEMADAALTSYEFACEWEKSFYAAKEYAVDMLKVKPTRAQCATAVNLAKTKWQWVVINKSS